MNDHTTKAREQAESAFNRMQTPSSAKSRTILEMDAVAAARDEKTLRLRELRLEKEAAMPAKAPATRKATKR